MAPTSPSAILLAQRDGQRDVVAAMCPVGARAGVRRGMTIAHARALTPADAHIEPHDPRRDERALSKLAVWATRLAPRVAPDPPDGLLMDMSGCERLYGGVERLLDAVHHAFETLRLPHRVALAPTFAAAWGAARYSESSVVMIEENAPQALMALPIEALRLDEPVVAALRDVGVETIEQMAALPRASLPARFGESAVLRLDQMFGRAMETITPVRPAPPVRAQRVFDGPTDRLEAVMFVAKELLGALCDDLWRRQCGARRVTVTLFRSDLSPLALSVRLSRPSRDLKHIWSLLEPKIERAHLGCGVECVRLAAGSVMPMAHEQRAHWVAPQRADADESLGRLLDTLVSRLGDARVTRLEPRESHIPERAFFHRAATASPVRERAALPASPRPSRLFDRPRPIEASLMTPEGPLMLLREAQELRRVRQCVGPERIGGEWWRSDEPERDYYRAQMDDGRWVWVFRRRSDGRWFLHGEWV